MRNDHTGLTPRRILAAVLAAASLGACMEPATTEPDVEAKQLPVPAQAPNVLVIMTDDQPVNNTLAVMPKTRRWFRRRGTTFTDAFATTPLCCPSRASIFTGRYVHNHGVHTSRREDTQDLDHDTTMQRYLSEAGYRNAIFGKYLNSWDLENDPPYFDDWAVIPGGKARAYYGGDWNVDGEIQTIDRYSTSFIRERGLRFLEDAEQEDARPWMMFLNVYAPHQPTLFPKRYASADIPPWRLNPARRETDFRDKPSFIPRKEDALAEARQIYKGQMRTLIPVDEMVDAVMSRVKELGENRDTLAFFVSDNGFLLGEHGLLKKSSPYTASVRIPLIARWPGNFEPGTRDGSPTANIDIAPTVYEAAGVTPEVPVDGVSLLTGDDRRNTLLEYWHENDSPRYVPWASLRSKRFQYIEYYERDFQTVRFREYYNLRRDPWQLTNLLRDGNPSNDPDLSRVKRRLKKLRDCSGDGCR